MLLLLQGPAGGGKSQVYRELLRNGWDIVVDFTALYVALTQVVRGPDGKYPIRYSTDKVVRSAITSYLKSVAVRQALQSGLNVIVTTSSAGEEARWREIARSAGVSFQAQTIDPGQAVVRSRLSNPDGGLAEECLKALSRWYR